jgi:hypothetical protein
MCRLGRNGVQQFVHSGTQGLIAQIIHRIVYICFFQLPGFGEFLGCMQYFS